jgi:hypothetical protein
MKVSSLTLCYIIKNADMVLYLMRITATKIVFRGRVKNVFLEVLAPTSHSYKCYF